jgi:Golgi to ER traffic protein 4
MKHGYAQSESDLFVARAMLELISRSENFELAKKLRKQYFSEVKSPIINFAEMLPEVIGMKDFALFGELIKKYDAHIKRDPVFMTILDRIAQKYFDG